MNHVDLIVYGHSHKYEYDVREGVIYLNPGGCGRRRFSLPLTMAFLYLNDERIKIEKIELT
jgi:predicted phosphodiesterase